MTEPPEDVQVLTLCRPEPVTVSGDMAKGSSCKWGKAAHPLTFREGWSQTTQVAPRGSQGSLGGGGKEEEEETRWCDERGTQSASLALKREEGTHRLRRTGSLQRLEKARKRIPPGPGFQPRETPVRLLACRTGGSLTWVV